MPEIRQIRASEMPVWLPDVLVQLVRKCSALLLDLHELARHDFSFSLEEPYVVQWWHSLVDRGASCLRSDRSEHLKYIPVWLPDVLV